MRSLRIAGCAAILIAVTLAHPPRAHSGYLSSYVDNPDTSTISLHVSFHEDPSFPSGHPEWVGFDVIRRSVADCGPYVRVNDQPFPRVFEQPADFTFTESPPLQRTLYEYRVRLVDANRNGVSFGFPTCEPPCNGLAWASSPALSAPSAQGTLYDMGWALLVNPCGSSCYSTVYMESGCCLDELRAFAGTGTVVNLYGRTACGSVEGCSISPDRFEVTTCDPVPTRSTSWGRLKLLYR